jgi:hypothetical protein
MRREFWGECCRIIAHGHGKRWQDDLEMLKVDVDWRINSKKRPSLLVVSRLAAIITAIVIQSVKKSSREARAWTTWWLKKGDMPRVLWMVPRMHSM